MNFINFAPSEPVQTKNSTIGFMLVIVTLIGSCIISFFYMCHYWFMADDAYISMRYAINWVEGRGIVYNIGERVEGYTNFLWVAYLALCYKLGLRLPAVANWTGIACSLLTACLMTMLWMKLYPKYWWLTLLLIIGFSQARINNYWATGGLETAAFGFLALCSLCPFFLMKPSKAQALLIALLNLSLGLMRPDGVILTAVLFSSLLIREFWHRTSAGKFHFSISKNTSLMIGTYVLLGITYLLWKLYYYGELLPNTFHNKVFGGSYHERGIPFLLSFSADYYFLWWGAPLIILCVHRNYIVRTILAQVVVYILYIVVIGGDWMGYRFFRHIFPLIWFLEGILALSFLTFVYARTSKMFRYAISFLTALCLLLISYYLHRPMTITHWQLDNPYAQQIDLQASLVGFDEEDALEIAEAFQKIFDPEDIIATSSAGFKAVYHQLTVIDVFGQTDYHIAHNVMPGERGVPGHEKMDPHYIEGRRPICMYPWLQSKPQINGISIEYGVDRYLQCFLPVSTQFSSLVELYEKTTRKGLRMYLARDLVVPADIAQRLEYVEQDPEENWDFELGTWHNWTIAGEAFRPSPDYLSREAGLPECRGVEGTYFANSKYSGSDEPLGSIERTFFIAEPYLSFRVGGGSDPESNGVHWIIEGKIVFVSGGRETESLEKVVWDLRDFTDKKATLKIVDHSAGVWGYTLVDDIRFLRSTDSGMLSGLPRVFRVID